MAFNGKFKNRLFQGVCTSTLLVTDKSFSLTVYKTPSYHRGRFRNEQSTLATFWELGRKLKIRKVPRSADCGKCCAKGWGPGGQWGSPGGMAGWGMCHTNQGIKQKLLLSCT